MANGLISGGYYTIGAAQQAVGASLDLRGLTYRQFTERQTHDLNVAVRDAADQQARAVREQTRADRENAMAIVASNAAIARINEQGFAGQHNDALMMNDTIASGFSQQHIDALMLNNTLETGFSGLSSQLGRISAVFNAGFGQLHDAIGRMSAEICNRLDAIHDTAQNPLRTQARELYTRAVNRYGKGLFEESLKDIKAAVEKDETHYLSWILMGNLYLFGAGEFSNVVDLDQSIEALTNAAKYISPDSMTKEARTKKIYHGLEPYSGEGLIKAIMTIGDVGIEKAWSIWGVYRGNTEAISRYLAGLYTLDRTAAEIYFYLGLAKYYKSNDLILGGAEEEAESARKSALQAFNRSLEYSDEMLESRYNTARCRTLLGDSQGALKELEAAVKRDRNYALKVLEDSDFDGIGKDVTALIDRIRKETCLKAKGDWETLRARLADTVFLDGAFSEMIQKMAAEWIPQTIEADLPYFDLLDMYGRLQIILAYLNIESYPCDRQVAELDTAELKDRGVYLSQDMFFKKLHNESIVLVRDRLYQLLGYEYTTIMRPGKITLTDAGGGNPLGNDAVKCKEAGRTRVIYRSGIPEKKEVIIMDPSSLDSSFSATSLVWRFAFSFEKSKDSEHQGFGLCHAADKNFFFRVDTAQNIGNEEIEVCFDNRIAVFLNKETLMVLNREHAGSSITNIKVFQPDIIRRSEFEAVEQRERQIAAEEARRRAEEAKQAEEARRRAEEERRRAEEEQAARDAARDAAERARYKKQHAVWLTLRIMCAAAFAALSAYILGTYIPLLAAAGSPDLKLLFILLALTGCALGGIFGAASKSVVPIVMAVMGVMASRTYDLNTADIVFIAVAAGIVGGLCGCITGAITGAFYKGLKKTLKAELKLEPRTAPSAGIPVNAPAAGTVLRCALD
jgi:tetratricopeptide (TPR) repeat protein